MKEKHSADLEERFDRMADAVLRLYLRTGNPQSVIEIARECAVAPGTVHRWIRAQHGFAKGCAIHSGRDGGNLYSPTRERLRNELLLLQKLLREDRERLRLCRERSNKLVNDKAQLRHQLKQSREGWAKTVREKAILGAHVAGT